MRSLAGRVLAVAGAGGSLGPVVVERLASAGAELALAGRDRTKLEALGVGEVDSVDLQDEAAARGWAESIVARHRRVDGLVHIVGGWRGGPPIEEQPAEDWEWLEGLLVVTLQNATRAFAAHLMASGHGRFVIVSSAQAQAPTSGNASYAAAKAASETWTLALADRFRGSGATANIVVVGAIVTPRMRAEKPDEPFATFTPAEEIAEAIAYLCSDAAASMNGQRLVLRGGA
jgi:NAD(P)-dependent dehydrogenase (short-subunit alcohol dehydrogenase family)